MWPPLRIGDVISNARLADIFKVANMGGMRYSKTYDALILVSNHFLKLQNPQFNPFDDQWKDGVFYYTGEGSVGDQTLRKQNKRLAYEKYETLHLFEVFSKGEYVYRGRMNLAGTPLYGNQHPKGRQPDANGRMRNVWIFPLKKV